MSERKYGDRLNETYMMLRVERAGLIERLDIWTEESMNPYFSVRELIEKRNDLRDEIKYLTKKIEQTARYSSWGTSEACITPQIENE